MLDKPSQGDLGLLQSMQADILGGPPAGKQVAGAAKALWSAAAALIFPQDEKLLAGTSCNSSTIPLGPTTCNRLTRDAFADPE